MGQSADRGRVHGVRCRPETGCAASGDLEQFGRQERQERCPCPGRHGPDPPAPVASGRRGFRHRGRGQGRCSHAPDDDLGTDPAHAAAAGGVARVLPAALEAYAGFELTSRAVLALLAKAPTPAAAAKLTPRQIAVALKGCRDIDAKAAAIQQVLRSEHLGQPEPVTAAYAATVRSLVAVLTTLNTEIASLEKEVKAHFGQHPDAEILLSQPGLGVVLAARVLAEFGDAPDRYASAKARKNYAGTSPITRQSGKMRVVAARFVHNDRLVDALHMQASCALLHDQQARAYYDQIRGRDVSHNAALRQLGNRLVGILHGCLKTHTTYDQATAWSHRQHTAAA